MSRTVEFVVKNLRDFDTTKNITRSRVQEGLDCNRLSVFIFVLPWTKVSVTGEDVYWARQDGPADPQEAFLNHLRINDPPAKAALFSWKHPDSLRALMQTKFIRCIEEVATSTGIAKLHFHRLQIGSVLEYLL